MSESDFLMPSQRKIFNYVSHFSSECDIVDADGTVYMHINDFKTKEEVKETAQKIKHSFRGCSFRTTTNRDYKGKIVNYSLYADLYSFYTIPYRICYLQSKFNRAGDECKKCHNYDKCLQIKRLQIKRKEGSS